MTKNICWEALKIIVDERYNEAVRACVCVCVSVCVCVCVCVCGWMFLFFDGFIFSHRVTKSRFFVPRSPFLSGFFVWNQSYIIMVAWKLTATTSEFAAQVPSHSATLSSTLSPTPQHGFQHQVFFLKKKGFDFHVLSWMRECAAVKREVSTTDTQFSYTVLHANVQGL